MEIQSIKKLVSSTKTIIRHHNELAKLKGENFNIFSILKMESNENETHSAFLGELLNPKGSHEKGAVFLKLFLEEIGNKTIQVDTAKTVLEKHVGKRDDNDATGGRIDIYIFDKSGNYLSIENKIYANDQNLQLKRYYNHNKDRNDIYYLTLYGEDASIESKNDLVIDKDYYCISYQKHIISWLYKCLKESSEHPILRETIKQYIILIKKITNTLNTQQEKELTDVLVDNLLESEYIAINYFRVLNAIRDKFRNAVATSLKNKLDDKVYDINIGDSIDNKYAQLWIDVKAEKEVQLRFGVETFSGKTISHGDMFVGILDKKGNSSEFPLLQHFDKLSDWWPHYKYLENNEAQQFNMANHKVLKLIKHVNTELFNAFVTHVSNQIEAFINENEKHVLSFLKK